MKGEAYGAAAAKGAAGRGKSRAAQAAARADRILMQGATLLSFVAVAAAAVILLATVGNIVLRAFFNRSMNGSIEISADMMVIVAFCALPAVTLTGGHISVDLLVRRFPARAQRALKCFNLLLGGGVCLIAAKYIFNQAAYQKQLGTSGSSLYIPYYPFYYLIAFMMLLCALCALYNLLRVAAVGEEAGEDTREEAKAETESPSRGGEGAEG
jgi:TRAP-type C4-dicarboxylate transport system permease small subunit